MFCTFIIDNNVVSSTPFRRWRRCRRNCSHLSNVVVIAQTDVVVIIAQSLSTSFSHSASCPSICYYCVPVVIVVIVDAVVALPYRRKRSRCHSVTVVVVVRVALLSLQSMLSFRCYHHYKPRRCKHNRSCYLHHRLNGSSSPVLTATSLSYGKAKNSTPPQNQNPWSDWDKIWHGWLRRLCDPSCKILCKSAQGGLFGK